MTHTCGTARSGSENGNTCAACHEELQRARVGIATGYGNLMDEWLRQTAGIGKKTNPWRLGSDALEEA